MFLNNANGSWFWPVDGVVVNSSIYLFSLRMNPSARIRLRLRRHHHVQHSHLAGHLINSPPLFTSYSQIDSTGLFVVASGNIGSKIFGQAVMNNSAEAGAYRPDGYVYVYGVRNDAFNKKMLVARVPRLQSASLAVSVLQRQHVGHWCCKCGAANRGGSSLVGVQRDSAPRRAIPDGLQLRRHFRQRIDVPMRAPPLGRGAHRCAFIPAPEADLTPNTYVYGAKAHPAISPRGTLLISYHVNSFDFGELYASADIYHPRFVSLRLTQPVGPTGTASGLSVYLGCFHGTFEASHRRFERRSRGHGCNFLNEFTTIEAMEQQVVIWTVRRLLE